MQTLGKYTYIICDHMIVTWLEINAISIIKSLFLQTFSLIGTTALHCGQTLLGGMTNGNWRNSQPPSALHRNWEEMAASVHTTTRGKYYNAHAYRFPQEKWPTVRMAVNGGSAGSLQRSDFRENPTNFWPSLPAEYVTAFSGRTDAPEVRCDLTDTERQTQLQ